MKYKENLNLLIGSLLAFSVVYSVFAVWHRELIQAALSFLIGLILGAVSNQLDEDIKKIKESDKK